MKKIIHDKSFIYDPYMDWAFMLGIAAALAIVLLGVGFLVFQSSKAAISAPPSVAVGRKAPAIDAAALSAVLQSFDARAAARAALVKGYGGAGDPSL